MEITAIDATTHAVPVEPPLLDRAIEVPIVFVTVETDTGHTGYGETGYLYLQGVREYVNREIAPLLVGADPREPVGIQRRLRAELNPRDQTGVWSSAVSAVDIALWDLAGKHYGEPVWRLLGGARNEVPAYVTFGLSEYSRDQLVEVAENLVADGTDKLKMVVGAEDRPDPIRDARRIHAVREAIGEDVELMIDANYGYSPNRALEFCNRVENANLTWFEEPVSGNDPARLAELRSRTRIPIAAGQNEGDRFRFQRLIDAGAVDIPQPNVCFVGGFTEARRVAAIASANNLLVANGGAWPLHNLHLQGGVENGWRVEFHYLVWKADEQIYEETPEPDGGAVLLPEGPGLGLEPVEERLAETETDRPGDMDP